MRNQFYILFFIMFFCGNISIVSAQQKNNYEKFRAIGQNHLRNGECDKALRVFTMAKNSKDCPPENDIARLIQQARDCKNKSKNSFKNTSATPPKSTIKDTATTRITPPPPPPKRSLELLFHTDYLCRLYINNKEEGLMEVNIGKKVSLTHTNPQDTFSILALSIPDNIKYERKIITSNFKNRDTIQIKLKDSIPEKELEITIKVEPQLLNFQYSGGIIPLNVDVNPVIEWNVDSLPPYCTVDYRKGIVYGIKCDTNPAAEERKDFFILRAGPKKIRVDIIQEEAPVYLDIPLKKHFIADAGEMKTFSIKTNLKSVVINKLYPHDADWARVTQIEADSFNIECDNNPSVFPRSVKYEIVAEDVKDIITIEQSGKPEKLVIPPMQQHLVFKARKNAPQERTIMTTTGEYTLSSHAKWYTTERKREDLT